MKRRNALKGIVLFSLGTGIILSCADKYKAIRELNLKHFKPLDKELDMLEILSDIIVPIKSIPELSQHTPLPYIFTMLDDVYEEKQRNIFLEGYKKFDNYVENLNGKKFTELKKDKQTAFVARLNNEEEGIDADILDFFNILKGESVQYFVTSEYYQRKINYYEMAPGRHKGDVLVSELQNKNDI